MFDFDEGQTGSQGPFVSWSAKGTEDGAVDSRNFLLRKDGGEKEQITDKFKKGVVFDITEIKTGWQHSSGAQGVAPEWKWNASTAKFEPKPGDDWKKGFSIPVALSKDQSAIWEQAGAGAFEAIKLLMRQVKEQAAKNKGLLPVVKMTGAETIKFSVGSTNYPVLEIVKWTEAPDCLNEAAAVATEEPAAAADEPEEGDEF